MKLFYWCPIFTKVATEKAVINSALSISKYSKKKITPYLIDVIGEWEDTKYDFFKNEIKIHHLLKFKIIKYLPKLGYLKSRFSYLIIFILSVFKLHSFLKNERPEFLIIHLLTSIPLMLLLIFKYKTKFILRISGLPKLNFFRKLLWKLISKKIYYVTTPTFKTKNFLIDKNIFNKSKIRYLPDPVLNIKNTPKRNSNLNFKNRQSKRNKLIAIGRLTKQKNFEFLINAFSEIHKDFPNTTLLILGDGEEKEKLKSQISDLNLDNKISLQGYKKNIFYHLYHSDIFIMTSLWEDPGFVLIEAGYANNIILSSDCPNGPNEILDDGKNGYLFKSNSLIDFKLKFSQIQNSNETKLYEKKILLKKKIKDFTIYNHYKILSSLII